MALCPHLNTAHFDADSKLPDDVWLNGDLVMLARCDALVTVPGWQSSAGATDEVYLATDTGIEIWHYPELPPLHPVEQTRPEQIKGFIDTLMRMYRLHLSKNSDYSPANILGTGEVGLMTRLWDKMARLMNLTGFQIEVQRSEYQQPKDPKHESVDDSLIDLANYAVIGILLRLGVWGR